MTGGILSWVALGFVMLALAVIIWSAITTRRATRNARQMERLSQENADYENAADIRRRVSRADERLREFDDAGYRD